MTATPPRAKRVAVIGGGVGGLVAAGQLAKAGARVTLFEAGSCLGGKAGSASGQGITLDTGPTLLTMPEVVLSTFASLDATDLLPELRPLEEQCRYRWQDGASFSVHHSLDATFSSVDAMEPGSVDAMRTFYRSAEAIYRAMGKPYLESPYDGVVGFSRRVLAEGLAAAVRGTKLGSLDSFARRVFRSEKLVQFAGRFATYAGASPFHASAAFAMIAHLEQSQGVFHPVGGMGSLARALGSAVQRLGVKVELQTRARFSRRRGELVAGPTGGERAFDAVVVNADPLAVQGDVDTQPLAMSGYVLLLDVDRRVALPHHSIFFSKDSKREFSEIFGGQQPEDGTLYVCHPAVTDASMAPANRSGLFVMLNAPVLHSADVAAWPKRAEQLQAWCIARLRAESSELRDANVAVIRELTPVHFAANGAPRGSIYGFLPKGTFGPFRRPSQQSATHGVTFAGGGTHPGGGVPLVMLSGRYAASLTSAELGLDTTLEVHP